MRILNVSFGRIQKLLFLVNNVILSFLLCSEGYFQINSNLSALHLEIMEL